MITYAITVCDESDELRKLLSILIDSVGSSEILIQFDADRVTESVQAVIDTAKTKRDIISYGATLINEDFAAFKNNVFDYASGDWIFHIDADEYPDQYLLKILPDLLCENDVDAILVPRVNTVQGLTIDHLRSWNWSVSVYDDPRLISVCSVSDMSGGYLELVKSVGALKAQDGNDITYIQPIINYPDYQWRLFRNRSDIRWVNRVHERIGGVGKYGMLPTELDYSLWHHKKIERQVAQNERYSKIV